MIFKTWSSAGKCAPPRARENLCEPFVSFVRTPLPMSKGAFDGSHVCGRNYCRRFNRGNQAPEGQVDQADGHMR